MEEIFQTCQQANPDDAYEALECVSKSFNDEVTTMDQQIASLAYGFNTFFLIFASVVMFIMQAGFGMLCAGSVRRKNVQNTMLKNFLDACGAGISFFCFGFAIAYGGTNGDIKAEEFNVERSNTFIGTENWFLIDYDNYAFWFYQFVFAATSTTIVAGTLAERSQMIAYFFYSVVLSGFVFPVVAHAVWCIEGFLNPFKGNRLFDCGMLDIAGSGVVHVTGGLTALIASKILGPRIDRFRDEEGNIVQTLHRIQGYSVSLQVLGTFLLWFGWYGFNAGSVHFSSHSISESARVASLSVVNTTLGAAAGTITAIAASAYTAQKKTGEVQFDIVCALNGCLAGLVGITGGCTVFEPWAALLIGSVSGLLYLWSSNLLVRFEIDDAVDAIPVHLFNGIWGVIAVGLFASPQRLEDMLHRSAHVGMFYSWGRGSSDARLLATNIVGLLFIIGFVFIIMFPFFMTLQYLGWFRADPLEEIIGLDFRYKGEADHESHEDNKTQSHNRRGVAKGLLHHGVTSGAVLHHSCRENRNSMPQNFEGVLSETKQVALEKPETIRTTETPTL